MKILFAITKMNRGGAENVAVVLANSLVQKGHKVFIATDLPKQEASKFYKTDERVVFVRCFQGRHPLMKTIRLRSILKKLHIDFAIGIMCNASLMLFVAALNLKTIVVASEHNAFERPQCSPYSIKQYFFRFVLNRIYPCVTVLTEADRKYAENRLKNIVVMPNPLSMEPISEINFQREKKILAAGRIDVWHCKGFDILLKAWSKIYEQYPDWRLEIAGAYSESSISKLLEITEDLHLKDKVVFSGFHEDMASLFQSAELFVLSSRYEGFGMVLIEAMSQGCACVACDYKGRQREIIKDENQGVCIPVEDVEALSCSIKKLIDDELYRMNVQKNAVERSNFYRASKIADKWVDLLENLKEEAGV